MARILNDEGLDTLFRAARSPQFWLPEPVGDTILEALAGLVHLAPPVDPADALHIVFVRSAAGKSCLAATVRVEDRDTILDAPIAVILSDARSDGESAGADRAVRSSGLPGAVACSLTEAHLIFAARALGLDCTPIWMFDRCALDGAFFADGRGAARFVCALGHGDETCLTPPCKPSGGLARDAIAPGAIARYSIV